LIAVYIHLTTSSALCAPLRDLHGSLALLRDAAGKEDNLAYDEEAFKAAWAHSDINLTASEL